MPNCRGCGKEIKFIKVKTGRWMPCDTERHTVIKDENGSMTLVTEDGDVIKGIPTASADGANASGYISHFATCPMANNFRGRR